MPVRLTILAAAASVMISAACAQRSAMRQSADDAPVYALPFPVGDSARLIQGNNGPWGHSGAAAYAYDFVMPIGSPVTAARGGTVAKVENQFQDGNRTPGQENFVVIRHSDGTYGRYYHLTQGGTLVAVGQRVVVGDTIGRSGNTGASAGPHLHFDVTGECMEWGCQTVAVTFHNAGSTLLVQGQTYRAQAR